MYKFHPYNAASVFIIPQLVFIYAVVRFVTNPNDDIAGICHNIVHVTHIVLPVK